MAMTDMKDNVAILGNTALMGIDNHYIVNQRVGLLRRKNNYNISYPFIYILTNNTDFLTDLRKRANSGVQVNLSSTEIKNSEVVIATKEINLKFDNIVKPFFEQVFNNNLENSRLTQLRDTLLPKLMSGEIDVENVDISTDKLLFNGGINANR
jgi:type I restriction enzyme S subunit